MKRTSIHSISTASSTDRPMDVFRRILDEQTRNQRKRDEDDNDGSDYMPVPRLPFGGGRGGPSGAAAVLAVC